MKYALLIKKGDKVIIKSNHKTIDAVLSAYRRIGSFRRMGTFGETFLCMNMINNQIQRIGE